MNGYNIMQNAGNQVVQNAVHNLARAERNGNGNNGDIDEIEEVNANCILMANLQQASTSGTQTNKAPVYVSNRSAEKLDDENVSLKFQVMSLEKENEHLKAIYQNLFDSIKQTRAQTKIKNDSLQEKLNDTIYENAKLREQLHTKSSKQNKTVKGTSVNTKFAKPSILGKPPLQPLRNQSVIQQPTAFQSERLKSLKTRFLPKVVETINLTKPTTSHSVPKTQESKVIKNANVIAPGMFRINPLKNYSEGYYVPNKPIKASVRIKSTTVSLSHVNTKKYANYNSNGLSSIGADNTLKTKRPHPRINTKNDWVLSASKSSCIKNIGIKVEELLRNLLLSKNQTHMSSECNNIKFPIWNNKSDVVYAMCKQCLITANHDVYVLNYVIGMNVCDNNQSANVSNNENHKKHKPKVKKPKSQVPKKDLLHQGLIALDLEVAFRRNSCFIKNLEGVDLLKRNRTTNLYTINLYEMASAYPICLMDRDTLTKSWLWHQRLSHLNFDTINELARNDFLTGLLKFKYIKEHLCPLCEQAKSKKAPHKPKPIPNLKKRLHLLHIDLCGPMRVESINRKRTKKIMKTINVTFDELSSMAFEQCSSKPKLQGMTSGRISSGVDLTFASSTITSQKPTEHELKILFQVMYADYIGGQSLDATRIVHAAPLTQNN
nr:integrase, catalytic region, zinc finger, CCHC-type, peptidase aspartic, catalytic [Tanacetum cinerariifolium]